MRDLCLWIECGRDIDAYSRADAKFCSPQCRKKAHSQMERYRAFCAGLFLIRPSGRFRSERRA